MSITSLYSTSSSGSSRKSSLERPSMNSRKLSIELLPNQAIFRETFLGAAVPRLSSPIGTPIDEEPPLSPNSPRMPLNQACSACVAMSNSPSLRRGDSKRHAVILPTRHQGPHCRMPPPPNVALPALPSIGEDCLVEWERKGSMAIAHNIPSPAASRNSTPLSSPLPRIPTMTGGDYFAVSSRATDMTDSLTCAMPSPRIGFSAHPRALASSPRIGGRPGTPQTPTKDYRSFMRML